MLRHFPARYRRLSVCGLVAFVVGTVATPALAQSDPLTLVFDTTHLGTFPTVSGSNFGVWSSGSTVADANIYVSFQWSNAGQFSGVLSPTVSSTNFFAVIGNTGTTLKWVGTSHTGTGPQWSGGSWYVNDAPAGSTGMSPAFSVAQMNSGTGTKIYTTYGNNMYIEYGKNSISGTTPPATGVTQARYTDVEWTFVTGSSFNNLDLTSINNAGAALRVSYSGSAHSAAVGFTAFTSDMLPALGGINPTQVFAAATASGSLGTGAPPPAYIAGVPQGATIPPGSSFYAAYPAYIATVLSGSSEAVKSPLLTNQPGGANPAAAALQQAQGFTGPSGSEQVAMFFRPTFTSANESYDITLTGSIAATASGGATKWYGTGPTPLTINISNAFSGSANMGFYGYLANGNVNNASVTLGGDASGTTGWQAFSNDFWQAGENNGATGNQGGPSPTIATGSSSSDSAKYGQIVQRALGDLQQLLMVGAFGNETAVSLPAVPLAGGSTPQPGFEAYSGPLGGAPSQNVWSAKSNAYLNTGTSGFNTFGQWIWRNSESVLNGTISTGAIYSNPYDDRFNQYASSVAINMDASGGTLTVQLREINAVPEPPTVALLGIGAVAVGGVTWRVRRRRRAAGRVRRRTGSRGP